MVLKLHTINDMIEPALAAAEAKGYKRGLLRAAEMAESEEVRQYLIGDQSPAALLVFAARLRAEANESQ